MEEIIRFNVYKVYLPEKSEEILFLECLTKNKSGIENNIGGYEWKTENGEGYSSIRGVARKIVELNKTGGDYKRVISANEPFDKHEGELEGILLNKSGIELVSELSSEQMRELAIEICNMQRVSK
jgi:hypothetical protein